jgi:hypothetical protein
LIYFRQLPHKVAARKIKSVDQCYLMASNAIASAIFIFHAENTAQTNCAKAHADGQHTIDGWHGR